MIIKVAAQASSIWSLDSFWVRCQQLKRYLTRSAENINEAPLQYAFALLNKSGQLICFFCCKIENGTFYF